MRTLGYILVGVLLVFVVLMLVAGPQYLDTNPVPR